VEIATRALVDFDPMVIGTVGAGRVQLSDPHVVGMGLYLWTVIYVITVIRV
jgi:hypothetical protein